MFARSFLIATFLLTNWISALCQEKPQITQDELVRRTQELFDAITSGDKQPFERHFADDATFFDEKGRKMDKKALVADIEPLPQGYSGNIKVKDVDVRMAGNVVIMSYDLDESETIFGQELHARYHETDTWMYRNDKWQIIAGQVLRYYEDPALGKMNEQVIPDYLGTYELAPGRRATVTREGNRLFYERTGRPRVELFPESPDLFFRRGVEGRILFRRGGNGKVDAILDRRNNEDVLWRKL